MENERPPAERPRRRVKLDLSELEGVFEDSPDLGTSYLDLETGRVLGVDAETDQLLERIYASNGLDVDADPAELARLIDESDMSPWQRDVAIEATEIYRGLGTRYLEMPQADTSEDYRDIEDFVETVQSERLRESLWRAIEGRGAFRRFRDRLLDAPQERERWFELKRERVKARVREWLESEGIELLP